MKKLIIPFLLVIALAFQACEPTESPIYDGSQTLAYFPSTSAQLGVPALETSASINVALNVSTTSSSDRTVNISVDPSSTAAASMYEFNSTVTIPANTYFAEFTITGFQNNLSETGDNLVLNIDGVSDGGVGSPTQMTILVVKTCPFDITNFYGTYSSMQVYNGTVADLAPGPNVTATAGPEAGLILLTDLFGPGRQAMIELDYSDPDNPTIVHRSLEFGAIYQGGTSVGDLYTTEQFAAGPNSFNTCTSGMMLNYLRTNGTSVYNWPYIVHLTKI